MTAYSQDSFCLPHWKELEDLNMYGEPLNPLQRFIFENTPYNVSEEQDFRDDLLAAIKYVLQQDPAVGAKP